MMHADGEMADPGLGRYVDYSDRPMINADKIRIGTGKAKPEDVAPGAIIIAMEIAMAPGAEIQVLTQFDLEAAIKFHAALGEVSDGFKAATDG